MNVIEQLKDNEKPFGLMSEEMQAKAREIGTEEFSIWRVREWGTPGSKVFDGMYTYRLRSDYAEEQEIVECEIYAKGTLFYRDPNGIQRKLSEATMWPDFIGFKFKDGKILPYPIKYGDAHIQNVCGLRSGPVHHTTHVLFRKMK